MTGDGEVMGEVGSSIVGMRGDSGTLDADTKVSGRLGVIPDYSGRLADITDSVFPSFPVFACDITVVTRNNSKCRFFSSGIFNWRHWGRIFRST